MARNILIKNGKIINIGKKALSKNCSR